MRELNIVEWNVHWGVARVPDRPISEPFDPLTALPRAAVDTADVLILPESWRGHDGASFLDDVHAHGFEHVAHTRFRQLAISQAKRELREPGEGWWKLAIASRHPFTEVTEIPLASSWRDAVPVRNALSVRVSVDDREVDVTGFHVSSKVWFGAPVVQLRSLAAQLQQRGLDGTQRPAIIGGDGNIWRAWIPQLLPGWTMTARGATFPSWRPHSQIDHICVRGAIDVVDHEVLPYSPTSDHRAIRARLQLR